jgi:hypothetical protein
MSQNQDMNRAKELLVQYYQHGKIMSEGEVERLFTEFDAIVPDQEYMEYYGAYGIPSGTDLLEALERYCVEKHITYNHADVKDAILALTKQLWDQRDFLDTASRNSKIDAVSRDLFGEGIVPLLGLASYNEEFEVAGFLRRAFRKKR